MKVENPYLKEKGELIMSLDALHDRIETYDEKSEEREKLKKEFQSVQTDYDKVERSCRRFTEEITKAFQEEIAKKESKAEKIKADKVQYPSLNKQLIAMRGLHKSAKELTAQIMDYKYELINETKTNSLKKKIVENTQVMLNETDRDN